MIKVLFALILIEIESEQESDSFLSFPRQPGIILTLITSKQGFIISLWNKKLDLFVCIVYHVKYHSYIFILIFAVLLGK